MEKTSASILHLLNNDFFRKFPGLPAGQLPYRSQSAKIIYDEENSIEEDRYDTIGNVSAGTGEYTIGNISGNDKDILFVVYTERIRMIDDGKEHEVTRIISARFATNFERGLYYGKY